MPVTVIERLLRDRPKVVGIGVAGMPAGSPGMDSASPMRYEVLAWDKSGGTFLYANVEQDGTVVFHGR